MMSAPASKTAAYMALFRALESQRAPASRLFTDPHARGFLDPPLRWVAELARARFLGRQVCRLIDWRWPGARGSGVARTRFIDERIEDAVTRGLRQLVLLGAGYDMRARRLACLSGCRVFELDHPATQREKQRRLRTLAAPSAQPVFVALDLAAERLWPALERAGFERAQASFILWEGVTNYLTEAAVDATLRGLARCARGSELLFTYVHRGLLDGGSQFGETRSLQRLLARSGERWSFGLYPEQIGDYLRERGYALLEDLPLTKLRERYFVPGPARGYEFYRIAHARLLAPGA
jgi:methyltransferase (TIGR00027 family)